jgi:hypothetical protein|tara:strand:+ start:11131 stop:11325 length:195 start_codon:yes stop_codon:yes gene_type:complete
MKMTQAKTRKRAYQILKSGKAMGIIGDLDYIINAIRNLESNLDKAITHSPFTIGLVNRIAKLKS